MSTPPESKQEFSKGQESLPKQPGLMESAQALLVLFQVVLQYEQSKTPVPEEIKQKAIEIVHQFVKVYLVARDRRGFTPQQNAACQQFVTFGTTILRLLEVQLPQELSTALQPEQTATKEVITQEIRAYSVELTGDASNGIDLLVLDNNGTFNRFDLVAVAQTRRSEIEGGAFEIRVVNIDGVPCRIILEEAMMNHINKLADIVKADVPKQVQRSDVQQFSDKSKVVILGNEIKTEDFLESLNSTTDVADGFFVRIPLANFDYTSRFKFNLTPPDEITVEDLKSRLRDEIKTPKEQVEQDLAAAKNKRNEAVQKGFSSVASIVNPKFSLPQTSIQYQWEASGGNLGIKELLMQKNISPFGLENRPETRTKVEQRFAHLLNYVVRYSQEARTSSFVQAALPEIAWNAYQVELEIPKLVSAIRTQVETTQAIDQPERSGLIAAQLLSQQLEQYQNKINNIIFDIQKKSVAAQQEAQAKQVAQQTAKAEVSPPKVEVDSQGAAWKQACDREKVDPNQALEQKTKLLEALAAKFSDVVGFNYSAVGRGQDYHYFYLRPHDTNARAQQKKLTVNANTAQDRLVARFSSQKPEEIKRIPTGILKNVYQEFNEIRREVKIHLMPKTEEELKVMSMVFELLKNNPPLRDLIDCMKLRVVDNNSSSDQLPEVVIYTNDTSASVLIKALLQELGFLTGTGKVPRYNQEVSNGLIYMAQSGGDLKETLREKGLLDKIFDVASGYAVLRV